MIGIKRVFKLFAVSVLSFGLLACGGDPDEALNKAYGKKEAGGNIAEILASQSSLSTLNTAIIAASLEETLQDETKKFTVFAPNNAAFDALGAKVVGDLLNDKAALTNILLYHVVAGAEINAYQGLKSAGKTIQSANSIKLSVSRSKQALFINGVQVVVTDLKANNGVVHVIDAVILPPNVNNRSLTQVKNDIIELAQSYMGITDKDFTLQRTFEPLLAELLTLAPQKPIAERLDLLSSTWKQIWGPYNYGSNQQGVDPDFAPDEIYQVVFKEGYYYNVTPLIDDETGEERIGMLRGQYTFDKKDLQCINVRFIRFPGLEKRPEMIPLWQLAELQETGVITERTGVSGIEIVPSWVVQSFFSGGKLCEIYTDDNLRISISTEEGEEDIQSLYVLTKVVE